MKGDNLISKEEAVNWWNIITEICKEDDEGEAQ